MPPQRWSAAWRRVTWLQRLSGLTLPPSTLDLGVAAFIASLPVIPAKATASPASSLAPTILDSSSIRFCASSMSAGLSVSSEKTFRGTRTANLPPSSRHWSEWATALNAEFSARAKVVPPMDGDDFSSWPTASARDGDPRRAPTKPGSQAWQNKVARGAVMANGMLSDDLSSSAVAWPTPMAGTSAQKGNSAAGNSDFSRGVTALVANWPTPTAINRVRSDETMEKCAAFRKANAGQNTVPLYLEEVATKWPTPMTRDHRSGHAQKSDEELWGTKGRPLERVAVTWPTPIATEARQGYQARINSEGQQSLSTIAMDFPSARPAQPIAAGQPFLNSHLSLYLRLRATTDLSLRSEMRALLRMGIRDRKRGWTRRTPSRFVRPSFRRSLNPSFVEFLMRWPIGWTDSACLETGSIQWLQRSRGYVLMLVSSIEGPRQGMLL